MAAADWSKAPDGILWKVIRLLSIGDYVRFGAVCVSWRAVLAQKRHPPVPSPWLLFDIKKYGANSPARFVSVSEKRVYHLDVPYLYRHLTCIGSSHGWLLFMDMNSVRTEILMFNPISRAASVLPSIRSLPDPDNINTIVPFPMVQQYDAFRVAISPRSSTFLASAMKAYTRTLVFAKEGDMSWTTIDTPSDRNFNFRNILFYKELLCGITNHGCVVAYNLTNLSQPTLAFVVQAPDLKVRAALDVRYLVESAGSLFQVWRGLREELEGGIMPWWTGRSDFTDAAVVTTHLRVFKLEQANGDVNWVELESLGDYSFFLGANPSVSISCHDCPELRCDSIYLTSICGITDAASNLLFYQMREQNFVPLLSVTTSSILNLHRECWFTPNLSVQAGEVKAGIVQDGDGRGRADFS